MGSWHIEAWTKWLPFCRRQWAFSSMKKFEFCSKFHWISFPKSPINNKSALLKVTPVYRGWLFFCTGPYSAASTDIVHILTSELFRFLSFLAGLMALTHRLPDYILVDFHSDLDLELSRSNMEFAISQPKMVKLLRNKKQTYRLNSSPQLGPSGLTLAMTLTFNFQGRVWNFAISQPKMVRLPQNRKQHIAWTLGLNLDHQVRPWTWPWPFFKVKYGICYISARNCSIAMKWKANISIGI